MMNILELDTKEDPGITINYEDDLTVKYKYDPNVNHHKGREALPIPTTHTPTQLAKRLGTAYNCVSVTTMPSLIEGLTESVDYISCTSENSNVKYGFDYDKHTYKSCIGFTYDLGDSEKHFETVCGKSDSELYVASNPAYNSFVNAKIMDQRKQS